MDDYRRDARCPACKLTPRLCVCADVVAVGLPVEILAIRHATERWSASNTGTLLPLLLGNARLVDHATPGDDKPFSLASHLDARRRCALLFPLHHATPLGPELLADRRPLSLIVLDATWSKARRMVQRIPELRALPALTLPPGPPAPGLLRKTRRPHLHSTVDATLRALEALGFAAEVAALRETVDTVLRRRLHVRGRLQRHELG